jgi:hypothetical protein
MWELIWLMLIMKIPIIYLCWVVYWAIKSEPRPEQPATLVPARDEPGPHGWKPTQRRRRPRPHGGPTRTYARTSRARVRA